MTDADRNEYFRHQRVDNMKFWKRIGGRPSFSGLSVLEVGCGLGAMSIDLAEAGTQRVLGIDLNDRGIDFARRMLVEKWKHLRNVSFEACPIDSIPGRGVFDIVVSKDTFEHIVPLEAVLMDIERLLRPGGRAFIGFSPLYYSPFGDHGELGIHIPWFHLIAGEARVVAAYNRTNGSCFRTLHEASFNSYIPRRFYEAFRSSGLVVRHLAINPNERGIKGAAMALFNSLRRIRILEKYFTIGIYAVLEKPFGSHGSDRTSQCPPGGRQGIGGESPLP